MSESSAVEINGGRLQDFTIDQMAGAIALSLGALGSLLLVIWQRTGSGGSAVGTGGARFSRTRVALYIRS